MGSTCSKQEEKIASQFFTSELLRVELYRARLMRPTRLIASAGGSLVLTTSKLWFSPIGCGLCCCCFEFCGGFRATSEAVEIELRDIEDVEAKLGFLCTADFIFDPSEQLAVTFKNLNSGGQTQRLAFSVDSAAEWKKDVEEAMSKLKNANLGW